MKRIKKITAILVLGGLPLFSANAAGVKEVAPNLFVPDYSGQELISKGCDPTNWNKLVSDYVAKRTVEKMVEKAQINQIIKSAPEAQGDGLEGKAGACFQSAIKQIDSAITTANQILSIFDGDFDFDALATSLVNKYAEQACKQVDYLVGAKVNRALSPATGTSVTGTLNTINNTINGATVGGGTINGATVGGVNVVSTAVIPSTSSYQIPYVGTALPANNSNQTWTGAAQTTMQQAQTAMQQQGFFSRINPFRSNVQNVPDPLK